MAGKVNKRGRMPDGTPNPVDVHVGKKIFTRRIEQGLSMEKLASSVGLTFQQVQKYERGMNRVSASRLFDFSKVLGVPINYFFSDLDNMTEQNSHSLFCRQPGQGEEDDFDDPLCREESRVLAAAYYKIADRSIAKTLFELMKALSRPNERTVEKQD